MSESDLADLELIRLVRSGKDDAWQELVRRHKPALLSRIQSVIGYRDQAEEIATETLIQAFAAINHLEEQEEFPIWLLRIAGTLILDDLCRTGLGKSSTDWSILPHRSETRAMFEHGLAGMAYGLTGRVAESRRKWLYPRELSPDSIIRMGHYQEARQGFRSDHALALACSVPEPEVTLWQRGEATELERDGILRDLAVVVSRLLEYYERDAVEDWLYGNSPDLGGRQPIKLLREGRLAEVLAVIEAQTRGAYV